MAVDLSRPLKAAIIEHIAADAGVTALVPADRIYAMAPPANAVWPFIRYGSPITRAYDATCYEGSTTRVTIHAFAESTAAIAGEDLALDIAAAVIEAMKDFAPDGLGLVENEYLQTNCFMEDREAERFHATVEFTVTVFEAP